MLRRIVLLFIKFYQIVISPFLGNNCRFYPSCSSYAYQAISKFGIKAIILVVQRLFKCHPFGSHGIDNIPNKLNYFRKKKNI